MTCKYCEPDLDLGLFSTSVDYVSYSDCSVGDKIDNREIAIYFDGTFIGYTNGSDHADEDDDAHAKEIIKEALKNFYGPVIAEIQADPTVYQETRDREIY